MIVCPGCERPNGLAARLCLYCGYRFRADPSLEGTPHGEPEHKLAERMVCDGCSAPLTENRREQSFRCNYCGTLYHTRNGVSQLVIYQPDSEGDFETHSDAGVIAESILEGVLGNSSRRSWSRTIRWGSGGDSGCLVALLFFPVLAAARTIARVLFRSRGW